MPKNVRSADRWTPRTTVAQIARSSLIDALSGAQLVVYIKLLGEVQASGSRRVEVINGNLMRDPRTAVRALRELEDDGLIKIHYDQSRRLGRVIEVSKW